MTVEKKEIAAGDRIITGSFQCQMQLTNGRTLVLSGQFYSDDTMEDKHARLDEFQALVDRQFIRVDVINKEAQREALVQGLESHLTKLEELNAAKVAKQNGDKSKPGLTSQEQTILKQGQDQVRGAKQNIAMLDSLIAAGKKKLQLSERAA